MLFSKNHTADRGASEDDLAGLRIFVRPAQCGLEIWVFVKT